MTRSVSVLFEVMKMASLTLSSSLDRNFRCTQFSLTSWTNLVRTANLLGQFMFK